jgi:hypothetical protein
VEEFVLKQAQLGIKRKTHAMSQDARAQAALDDEIHHLRADIERIRRQVGVYCMSYVRTIFPEDAVATYTMLEQLLPAAALPMDDSPLHRDLAARIAAASSESPPEPKSGVWGRLDL